jgi:hypothetical protein
MGRRQRGTGTVLPPYKMKNGDVSYRVQYYDASGKQVKETVGKASEGWTPTRVEKYLRERINAVEQKGYAKPRPVTFFDYAETWFEREQAIRDWAKGSADKYRWARDHCVRHFGSKRLTDITDKNVNDFGAGLLESYKPRTATLILTTLKMIFTGAEDDGLIEEGKNPCRKMKHPTIKARQPRALKVAEERREPWSRTSAPSIVSPSSRLSSWDFG